MSQALHVEGSVTRTPGRLRAKTFPALLAGSAGKPDLRVLPAAFGGGGILESGFPCVHVYVPLWEVGLLSGPPGWGTGLCCPGPFPSMEGGITVSLAYGGQ